MRPENGAESRKKTTVKWASVDPEFNEQVKIKNAKDSDFYPFSPIVCVHDKYCRLAKAESGHHSVGSQQEQTE